MAKTALDILKEAKAKVEAGWCQRSSRVRQADGSVSFCALGAMGSSSEYDESLGWDARQAAVDTFEEVVECNYIPTWNDVPGRTQAEVVAAFAKAISRLEGSAVEETSSI